MVEEEVDGGEEESKPATEEVEVEEEEEYEGEFTASELESFIRITDLWVRALKGNVKVEELKSTFFKRRIPAAKRGKKRS